MFRGVPLGPTCLAIIQKRASLRGTGTNSKMVVSTNTGLPHLISDLSTEFCPDNDLHCIECPNRGDKVCPLERAVQEARNKLNGN
jgi:hypothetical protein